MAPPPLPQTPGSPNSSRTSNVLADNSGVGAGPGENQDSVAQRFGLTLSQDHSAIRGQ
jgi:hypothetical protein